MSSNRRKFFQRAIALSGLWSAKGAVPTRGLGGDQRQQASLRMRQEAALAQSRQPVADHPSSGDETGLPHYVGSFTKGLPHMQNGEVETGAFETLLHALSTGKQADFESLDRGSGVKFVNPQGGFAFQMEGADSHCLGMPPAPSMTSAAGAADMVELYWQALARDVPFTDYDTSPVVQAATRDLSGLSAFHGPTASGKVSTRTAFRGNFVGAQEGPYISQFFWQPVPVVSTVIDQRYRVPLAGIDYLTTYPEWLVLQTGVPPFRQWMYDSTPRYIFNGRSLAEWVHYDFLYQAFHNAAVILLNQGPETVLNTNPYLNPSNPYKSTKVATGFVTFGAPDVCCLLGTVCQAALKAAWFQKWLVHRRLRPEAFGARVHQTRTGAARYPIHTDLLNSAALQAVFAANQTYLLPQSYPEGAPLHPSYPAGHATVSGACSALLKAFFDESLIMTNCVQATSDGLALMPYDDTALTVGGEVNKLAFNVAMGRNFAGIHYRSDAEASFRLGEEVTIALLQDIVHTYNEGFTGFDFTRMDGTRVVIK